MVGILIFVVVIFIALILPMLAPILMPAVAIAGIWLLTSEYTGRKTRVEDEKDEHDPTYRGW